MTGEVFWMIERAKLDEDGMSEWEEYTRQKDEHGARYHIRELCEDACLDDSDWMYRLTRCEVQ